MALVSSLEWNEKTPQHFKEANLDQNSTCTYNSYATQSTPVT